MSVPIIDRIRTADNLPSLSTVAMEILELCRDEDASTTSIGEIVQEDASLTAKLLKTVNSPFFGMPREVASPHQAITLLGVRTVKQLALSFSLVDSVGADKECDFDYQGYWCRSLTCAAAARLLGMALDPTMAEGAFAGGLLSELGMVAAWRCAPELYKPVLDLAVAKTQPLHEIELEELGVTHAAISRELLVAWNLPEILCDAVSTHHGDGLDALVGTSLECARLVRCGVLISEVFCRETPAAELDTVKKACRETSGIGEADLERVLDELNEHVQATALLLAVQIGDLLNYAQLAADADAQFHRLQRETAGVGPAIS